MKTIKITRSTICDSKDLEIGGVYEVKKDSASVLINLGKAVEVDSEADVEFEVNLNAMSKNELIEYAITLEIELPSKITKNEIIALIEDAELEEG